LLQRPPLSPETINKKSRSWGLNMTEPRLFVALQHADAEIGIAAIIPDLRGDEREMKR
jgi:hypothetical protein